MAYLNNEERMSKLEYGFCSSTATDPKNLILHSLYFVLQQRNRNIVNNTTYSHTVHYF